MNILKVFYEDEVKREAVKAFMIECLNELAVSRVMKRENTASLADAKEVVEYTFIRLREIYAENPSSKIKDSR